MRQNHGYHIKDITWWANAGVMTDQRKALVDTTELTDMVYLFTLPGLKLSTLGSASRDTAFLHYAKLDLAKEEGWTSRY